MSWKSTAVLLALSFLGAGSLVYLLYHKDEEKEADECLRLKTSRCTVIEVKIPKESIGIVIGRAGNTIKEIQAKSDTKINFKDEKVTDEYKVCVIRGTAEAAQYAESLIHEKIVSQPLIETYEMTVPIQAIGRIIGKNGENIRAISRNSNAKIIIENTTTSPVSNERKILIKGTSEQIALAKVLVEQKVEEDLECRNRIESKVANRSPRNKAKYLMIGGADPESTETYTHKEHLIATGSDGLLEVYVSAIESPDRLWVQMKGPCTSDLDRLQDQMTDYYTKDENRGLHLLKEVSCGQIVAAPFMYDEKWYRAEISQIINDEYDPEQADLELYYVDYGDSAMCKKKDVYELRTDFLKLRFQAIECILAKIKPSSGNLWTEEATDYLEELTHVALWKSLMAKIHSYKKRPTRAKREGSPVPCVELYDTKGAQTINVAEELVKRNHAVWDKEEEDTKSEGAKSVSELLKNERSDLNGTNEKEKTSDKFSDDEKCDDKKLNFADIEKSVIENGGEGASKLE